MTVSMAFWRYASIMGNHFISCKIMHHQNIIVSPSFSSYDHRPAVMVANLIFLVQNKTKNDTTRVARKPQTLVCLQTTSSFERIKFCQNGGSNKFLILGHDYYSTVHVNICVGSWVFCQFDAFETSVVLWAIIESLLMDRNPFSND